MNKKPGTHLAEIMEKNERTQEHLAEIMGKSRTKITEIINGKVKVNAEWAILLEGATGEKADFWLNLQQAIDLEESQREQEGKINEIKERLKLYDKFPIQELIKRGILKKTKDIKEMLEQTKKIFEINSLDDELFSQAISYRKKDFPGANQNNLEVRLSLSKKLATKIDKEFSVTTYNEDGLNNIIENFKSLSTKNDDGVAILFEELRKVGVIVVVLKHFEKTKIDGACYWHKELDKPVIVLSLRYHRLDNFWFTLSHEIGHIIKHKDFLKEDSFIEFGNIDILGEERKEQEDEANKFAQETLIENNIWEELIKSSMTPKDIGYFSTKGNVHEAILVGRLKFENILPYNAMARISNQSIDKGIPLEHTIGTIQ